MQRSYWLVSVLLLSGIVLARFSINQTAEDEIRLGMSTALTGPTADLGINMQTGVLAAIKELNDAGGIHRRKVSLITLDDGYEPKRTIVNVHQLVDQYHVLSIIGNVGTPTAVAAVPITNAGNVPFYGAFTGAGLLRKNPPDRYVINYRASYAEETAEMVNQLISKGNIKPEEIAFFTQRDTYGDAGFEGGMAALDRYGLAPDCTIAHGRYERNTLAVEKGLVSILLHTPEPKAVIMVGAYAPCAEFIRLSRQNGFHPIFLNVSFVGVDSLAQSLGPAGAGVIVTQVVPHYNAAELPIIRQYHSAMETISANPSFGSLEGYIAARIFFKALLTSQGPIDRQAVIHALEGLGQFDIGLGCRLTLNQYEHQACHTVWPTVIEDGVVKAFDWNDLPTIIGKQK